MAPDGTQNGTAGEPGTTSILYSTGNRPLTAAEASAMTGLTPAELRGLQYTGGLRLTEAAVGDLIARCLPAMTRAAEGT
jgi:hypothetical protein